MTGRCRAVPLKMPCAPCNSFLKSIMQTQFGEKPMISPIQTPMNNIGRFFTTDPVAFTVAYINYLRSVLLRIDTAEIGRFIETLLDARSRGATASHFANDLAFGTNDY